VTARTPRAAGDPPGENSLRLRPGPGLGPAAPAVELEQRTGSYYFQDSEPPEHFVEIISVTSQTFKARPAGPGAPAHLYEITGCPIHPGN
jgi:hypothetical protein